MSNNKPVLSTIPAAERDASISSLDLYRELPNERALDVDWSLKADV